MGNRISGLRKAGIIAVGGLAGLVGITSLNGCAKQEYVVITRDVLEYGINLWIKGYEGVEKVFLEDINEGKRFDITPDIFGQDNEKGKLFGRDNIPEVSTSCGQMQIRYNFNDVLKKEHVYKMYIVRKGKETEGIEKIPTILNN